MDGLRATDRNTSVRPTVSAIGLSSGWLARVVRGGADYRDMARDA